MNFKMFVTTLLSLSIPCSRKLQRVFTRREQYVIVAILNMPSLSTVQSNMTYLAVEFMKENTASALESKYCQFIATVEIQDCRNICIRTLWSSLFYNELAVACNFVDVKVKKIQKYSLSLTDKLPFKR